MKAGLIPAWVRSYRREHFIGDLVAGIIVTMLLVPQGLAFAALAGLPPQVGLYASLAPLVIYALFGSSMVLSVGPVAIASLMTATALAPIAVAGSAEYIAAAAVLALISGIMLFAFGMMRFGVLAQFLSHPVISGFITGAALLIIIGQIRPLLGISVDGEHALALVIGMLGALDQIDPLTAMVGISAILLLGLSRFGLERLLLRVGMPAQFAELMPKLTPMLVVILAAVAVAALGLEGRVKVVGDLPAGLPSMVWPEIELSLIGQLWLPALVIGIIGFVESVSIARAYAARSGHRIDPDAELRGLGAANIASGFTGAFPVTGGLSRTAVNAEAGARTPFAGVIAALLIALILLAGTGLFASLPVAILAATIIVVAFGLVDISTLRKTWRYDRPEGLALAFTAAGVLIAGVEVGIAIGISLSLATLIWRASRPHVAVLGRVKGTQHFRNIDRYDVETCSDVLILRIDENLFFGNAESVEGHIDEEMASHPGARHLVMVMSSVSYIDATALEMMSVLNRRLKDQGIMLHLAEVKGPVLDQLSRDRLLEELSGAVHLSAWAAFEVLKTGDEETGPVVSTDENAS